MFFGDQCSLNLANFSAKLIAAYGIAALRFSLTAKARGRKLSPSNPGPTRRGWRLSIQRRGSRDPAPRQLARAALVARRSDRGPGGSPSALHARESPGALRATSAARASCRGAGSRLPLRCMLRHHPRRVGTGFEGLSLRPRALAVREKRRAAMPYAAISFAEKFAKFSEHWSPKNIAQMNDYHFK